MSTEITIQSEISEITVRATELVVTAETMPEAVQMLSMLNKQSDRITEEKEKVTKPLNEALKAERARWKPAETILESAISTIRAKMTQYQTEARKRAEAEALKIAQRVGEGRGKLSIDKASEKISAIAVPEAKTATEAGSVSFRTVQKWRVSDFTKIPVEYLTTDDSAIQGAMKAGKEVPGVEYYSEEQVINRRTNA